MADEYDLPSHGVNLSQESLPLSQESFDYLWNEVLRPDAQGINIGNPEVCQATENNPVKAEIGLTSDINYEDNYGDDSSTVEHVGNLAAQIEVPSNVFAVSASPSLNAPSSLPASQTWPGKYGFNVSFGPQEKTTKGVAWTYSEMRDKLYVGKDVPCPINFSTNSILPHGVIIRAMALYTSPEEVGEVVHRCVNHSLEELKKGLFEAEHLIRCESSMAKYDIDSRTGHHSVIIPFENPPAGQLYSTYIYKFACFGSCAGGPNRRPLMLIFTLEKGNQVIGRKKLDVKICACPGRDRKTDETQRSEEGGGGIILSSKRKEHPDCGDILEFTKSFCSQPEKKKPKTSSNKEYTLTVSDKDCYEFLKHMKKYYEIFKLVKNIPPEVLNTIIQIHRKRSSDSKHE